ncbi:MAG: hypothetical protein HY587_00545 [Candidatus Omnitrophica bacterium]|nr:hypothetical protein [Candidatus Omnitrophota bacterium]
MTKQDFVSSVIQEFLEQGILDNRTANRLLHGAALWYGKLFEPVEEFKNYKKQRWNTKGFVRHLEKRLVNESVTKAELQEAVDFGRLKAGDFGEDEVDSRSLQKQLADVDAQLAEIDAEVAHLTDWDHEHKQQYLFSLSRREESLMYTKAYLLEHLDRKWELEFIDTLLRNYPTSSDDTGFGAADSPKNLPAYGDQNFWPGRLGIAQSDLDNLGVGGVAGKKYSSVDAFGHSRPREFKKHRNLEGVFGRFEGAPEESLEILEERLKFPRRTHRDILYQQNLLHSFIDSVQPREGETKAERIRKLVALVSEYSSAKKQFYKELFWLRDKHYERNRGKSFGYVLDKHRMPYPDVAMPLLLVGKMIVLLQEIDAHLPESQDGVIGSGKKSFQLFFSREDVKSFLEKKYFLSIASASANPWFFSDRNDPGFSEKTRYLPEDEESLKAGAGEQILRMEADGTYVALQAEFSDLMNRFGNLWELKDGGKAKPARKRSRFDSDDGGKSWKYEHAFLRRFPDRFMRNPLAQIDFYSRAALMILEDGWKFPEHSPHTATVKLRSFKNPLLNKERTRREPSRDAISPMQDKEEPARIEPLEIELGGGKSALLLSGPNMGGKTTTARGIALAVLLTQMGLPIPGDGEIGPFRNVYTVFPEPEQLQEGYGYFAFLIKNLTEMIKKVGPGDLVILDEVPIGTDYTELAAIAAVLFEDFIASGATVVVTGHLKKAFELLSARPAVKAMMHTTKEENSHVVPDFKLAQGVAKHSHAIELTTQAGFPAAVTELARAYYKLITEGREGEIDIPEIPTDVSVVAEEESEYEATDSGMIRTVAAHLYPKKNFAFEETWEWLLNNLSGSSTSRSDLWSSPAKDLRKGLQAKEKDSHVEAEKNLAVTDLLIAQGESFLDKLTKLLAALEKIEGPRSLYWEEPKFDPVKNEKQISAMEITINDLSAHLDQLKNEETITGAIPLLKEKLEEVGKLRERFVKADISTLDDKEKGNLHSAWKTEWHDFRSGLLGALTPLDGFSGLAKGVMTHGLKKPVYTDRPHTFSLKGSRPFYARGWRSDPFVKNPVLQSFEIDHEKPVFVITGPNSSGKTVLMFNARMNALFASRGMYVSGDLITSRFDRTFAFFGGKDAVGKGESYFLNILKRYSVILKEATPTSLVILDELHGTDNFELAALQLAVLHYLRSKGVTVIFNTHIRDGLKELADKTGLDLWKTDVDFDPSLQTVEPRYTASRDPELKAKSYGLPIAKQWLTPDQYKRAERIHAALTAPSSGFGAGWSGGGRRGAESALFHPEYAGSVIDDGTEMLEETQTKKTGASNHLRDVVADNRGVFDFEFSNGELFNVNQGRMDSTIGRQHGQGLFAGRGIVTDGAHRFPVDHRVSGAGIQDKFHHRRPLRAGHLDPRNDDTVGFFEELDFHQNRMAYPLGTRGPAYAMYTFFTRNGLSFSWSSWRDLLWMSTLPLSWASSVNLKAIHSFLNFFLAYPSFISGTPFVAASLAQAVFRVNRRPGASSPGQPIDLRHMPQDSRHVAQAGFGAVKNVREEELGMDVEKPQKGISGRHAFFAVQSSRAYLGLLQWWPWLREILSWGHSLVSLAGQIKKPAMNASTMPPYNANRIWEGFSAKKSDETASMAVAVKTFINVLAVRSLRLVANKFFMGAVHIGFVIKTYLLSLKIINEIPPSVKIIKSTGAFRGNVARPFEGSGFGAGADRIEKALERAYRMFEGYEGKTDEKGILDAVDRLIETYVADTSTPLGKRLARVRTQVKQIGEILVRKGRSARARQEEVLKELNAMHMTLARFEQLGLKLSGRLKRNLQEQALKYTDRIGIKQDADPLDFVNDTLAVERQLKLIRQVVIFGYTWDEIADTVYQAITEIKGKLSRRLIHRELLVSRTAYDSIYERPGVLDNLIRAHQEAEPDKGKDEIREEIITKNPGLDRQAVMEKVVSRLLEKGVWLPRDEFATAIESHRFLDDTLNWIAQHAGIVSETEHGNGLPAGFGAETDPTKDFRATYFRQLEISGATDPSVKTFAIAGHEQKRYQQSYVIHLPLTHALRLYPAKLPDYASNPEAYHYELWFRKADTMDIYFEIRRVEARGSRMTHEFGMHKDDILNVSMMIAEDEDLTLAIGGLKLRFSDHHTRIEIDGFQSGMHRLDYVGSEPEISHSGFGVAWSNTGRAPGSAAPRGRRGAGRVAPNQNDQRVIETVRSVVDDSVAESIQRAGMYKTLVFGTREEITDFGATIASYPPELRNKVLGSVHTVILLENVSPIEAEPISNELGDWFTGAGRSGRIFVREHGKRETLYSLIGQHSALIGEATARLLDAVGQFNVDRMRENGFGYMERVSETLRLAQIAARVTKIAA